MDDSGVKRDTGKPRMDLIPPDVLIELGELYGVGAIKYGDRNWEKGLEWGRVYAAAQRHLNKWWSGEEYDREDGQHHLTAAIFGLFALRHYQINNIERDTRPARTVRNNLKDDARIRKQGPFWLTYPDEPGWHAVDDSNEKLLCTGAKIDRDRMPNFTRNRPGTICRKCLSYGRTEGVKDTKSAIEEEPELQVSGV